MSRVRRRRSTVSIWGERLIEAAVHVAGVSAILFLLAIFAFVAREGLPALIEHAVAMWSSTDWSPTDEPPGWGILALLVGTLWCVGLSLLFSVPVGLAAAVYLAEFAPDRSREGLKVVVELLAAIPSVVWGFVGVMMVNPLLQWLGAPIGLNGLNGAILLALMTLPLLVSLGEDALRAVPDSYRQAAVAMGATRWEVVWRVLLPAARPGLLVAVLLGVGRCVGETMAVLMATGHAVNVPDSLWDPVRTLTATIAAELGEAVRGGDHYRMLFALGLLLFGITFVVNLSADLVIRGRSA
ncbi:MAG: phosphate ABC transporter permease subunit PstC [Myxococcales bacterium]|nr:phosphate ABC transporter permease subunit PstC [Myxococcales bacterium]